MPKRLIIDADKLRGAIFGKQKLIAEAFGIHPNSFSKKIRKGVNNLTFSELNLIAEVLDKDPTDFIFVETLSDGDLKDIELFDKAFARSRKGYTLKESLSEYQKATGHRISISELDNV